MTKEEGLKQIDAAQWTRDESGCLNLLVTDEKDRPVHAWLMMRPDYCDRGHIQLNIDGQLELDSQDSFPRYFFWIAEADLHTRAFLRWRLWKERTDPYAHIRDSFDANQSAVDLAMIAQARPADYEEKTPQVQWEIDKKLEILDWDGRKVAPSERMIFFAEQLEALANRAELLSKKPDGVDELLKITEEVKQIAADIAVEGLLVDKGSGPTEAGPSD